MESRSSSIRRAPLRFNNPSNTPSSSEAGTGIFGVHDSTSIPRSHLGSVGIGFKEEEKEELSDADEPGLKRVDISDVRDLDWMAPEALKKVQEVKRKNIKLKHQETSSKPIVYSSSLRKVII